MKEPVAAPVGDCRELYRLSGWSGTAWSWYCDEERDDDPACNLSEPLLLVGGVGYFDTKIPAYDAAYLTAMLPAFVLSKSGNGTFTATWRDYSPSAGRTDHIERWSRMSAANALCRLAIALFEAGVLFHAPTR